MLLRFAAATCPLYTHTHTRTHAQKKQRRAFQEFQRLAILGARRLMSRRHYALSFVSDCWEG